MDMHWHADQDFYVLLVGGIQGGLADRRPEGANGDREDSQPRHAATSIGMAFQRSTQLPSANTQATRPKHSSDWESLFTGVSAH